MELPVGIDLVGRDATARDTAWPVREEVDTNGEVVRELDRRTADRIDVRLLWRQRDGRVLVAVADGKAGDCFTIDVRDGERALDVFHHPYAYAAWRGIDTRADAGDVTPSVT
jgi:hypothetical protein